MQAPQQPIIFINYRRAKTKSEARVIYLELVKHFGKDSIFLDVKDTPAGEKWRNPSGEKPETSKSTHTFDPCILVEGP